MVVAAVHSVAACTTRLVTASRVKADPNSRAQAKLEDASREVKKATKVLANAVKESKQPKVTAKAGNREGVQARMAALKEEASKEFFMLLLLYLMLIRNHCTGKAAGRVATTESRQEKSKIQVITEIRTLSYLVISCFVTHSDLCILTSF